MTKGAKNVELTIGQCLHRDVELAAVSPTARLDIEVLLAWVIKQSRTYCYTWPEKALSREQQQQFEAAFARRLAGEPIAYITGQKEFWSLCLAVDNTTLIPRPETELLVEKALMLMPDVDQVCNVVDLGTGTGAIALALACERPSWQLWALDQAVGAVELAKANQQSHQLNNVTIMQSDWFAAIDSALRFDMIVSNPPYIDPVDPHLSQGDVRFEPLSALIAPDNGFAAIHQVIKQSQLRLLPGGWIIMEHGYQQAPEIRHQLAEHGFVELFTEQDLAGLDRISGGRQQ